MSFTAAEGTYIKVTFDTTNMDAKGNGATAKVEVISTEE